MRKLFLHMMISIDGYIDGPDGEMDWHFVDDEFEEYCNDMLHSIDGMVFGRVAFELLADYWPKAADNPSAAANSETTARHIETARLMNSLPKFVLSKTLRTTQWNNSQIVRDAAGEISRLKRENGKDIAFFAGAKAAASLMQLGLLDECRIIVNPVLLGGGTPLLQGPFERQEFDLVETWPFKSGALRLIYRPRMARAAAEE